ncbi:putative lactoylglutathione lyase chloroplastic [Zea mays]|uniref:Lactoylglutathione lyase n=1 Tax=Zea mays TaxID=4577 RepID=A0A1D6M0D9_MAIZE|nr:putative lactoylglutathione lyase chloroplastic [Zea mays]
MARLLIPLPFAAASASSLHLAVSRLPLAAVSAARRECLFGGRVVGGVVRAPARLSKRGLCAGAEAGDSAVTVEAMEWVKKDRRRLLHVVYRVGDLDKTIKFYTECLGMKLLRKRDIPEERYTNAFLGYGPEDSHFVVELTYNYGVESYNIGTGFGHFGIAVEDVAKTVELIKAKGGTVTREPGPVKGGKSVIAFIEDPDGYKFELIERGPTPEPLCQVMLRVGDLDRAINFYEKAFGMELLRKRDNSEYKLVCFILDAFDLVDIPCLPFTNLGHPIDILFSLLCVQPLIKVVIGLTPGSTNRSLCRLLRYPVLLYVVYTLVMISYAAYWFEWNIYKITIDIFLQYTIAMMGYGPEDKNAVLELTYNYGVKEYDKGNAYAQIAISTDDVYKTAEAIRVNGGQITREPGPLPGITTKITACTDPDGWKTVFVDNIDFLKELEE